MEEKKSFFELLDGKSALLIGLVGGILALGTIGFVVLGIVVLNGHAGGSTALAANQPAPQPTVGPQPTQQNEPAPSQAVGVGHFPAKGSAGAKVTVVEFADFRCPFCGRFFNDAEKGVIQDYVATGKVKYYFRSFAFLGQPSTVASEAAECANEQGKFWQFHDWLYEHQADERDTEFYSQDNLAKYAGEIGLNTSKFTSCLNSGKYAAKVSQDLTDGQNAGVNGTPTIFINGHPLVGAQPYSAVKAAIEQALTR